MRTARSTGVVAGLAAAAAVVSSCGMSGALGDDDAGDQTATVAVLAPRSGWQAADGDGVLAAVRRGITETTSGVAGWTVEVVAVDESDDATATAARISDLVAADGVAVIGGLTTAAIRAVQPVTAAADMLFVSPADVVPAHTRGADPQRPLRPYDTYYRTAVSDAAPAATLARYAVDGQGAQTAAVVDGGDAAEAKRFADAFRDAGGKVVVAGLAGDDHGPVAPLIDRIRGESADVVFVSGSSDVGVTIAGRVAQGALDTDVLGTSTTLADDFGARAGSGLDGTVRAVPPDLEPTEGIRVGALPDGADPGPYGAAAYDAARAVGTVLTRCLPPAASASAAREGCAGEMAAVEFDGVTGEVEFDRFGDRVGGVTELQVLREGRWEPIVGE